MSPESWPPSLTDTSGAALITGAVSLTIAPPSAGGGAELFSFLDVACPDVRGQLLDDGPIFEHVRRDRIEELIAKPDLPNSQSKFLFYFLNSKIFLEEHAA